jgi:hypothetical protein
VSGADMARIVTRVYALPANLVEKARAAVKP